MVQISLRIILFNFLIYLENSNYSNRGKIIVNYENIGSSNGIIGLSNGILPSAFSSKDIIENQIM